MIPLSLHVSNMYGRHYAVITLPHPRDVDLTNIITLGTTLELAILRWLTKGQVEAAYRGRGVKKPFAKLNCVAHSKKGVEIRQDAIMLTGYVSSTEAKGKRFEIWVDVVDRMSRDNISAWEKYQANATQKIIKTFGILGKQKKCYCRMVANPRPYQNMRRAIESLSQPSRDLAGPICGYNKFQEVYPKEEDAKAAQQSENPLFQELSLSQRSALQKATTQSLTIIQGGNARRRKVMTAALILESLARSSKDTKTAGPKVLFCAASNEGVDSVVRILQAKEVEVVRVYAKSRYGCFTNLNRIALHRLVWQLGISEREILAGAQVVATTCMSACDPAIKGFHRYGTVIIHEAHLAREPETLIPLALVGGKVTMISPSAWNPAEDGHDGEAPSLANIPNPAEGIASLVHRLVDDEWVNPELLSTDSVLEDLAGLVESYVEPQEGEKDFVKVSGEQIRPLLVAYVESSAAASNSAEPRLIAELVHKYITSEVKSDDVSVILESKTRVADIKRDLGRFVNVYTIDEYLGRTNVHPKIYNARNTSYFTMTLCRLKTVQSWQKDCTSP